MAISATHHFIIRDLFEHGLLARNGALLEFGEANWYGDLNPQALMDDINRFVRDPIHRDALSKRLTNIIESGGELVGFHIAKIFYEIFFAPSELQAVDFEGTQIAQRQDLNHPITLNRRFDVVINHGTAEHIFNIGQVFRTVHDYTLPGGLMIHESPFTGWIDHGFYSLQPTLYFDLADFNQYALFGMFVEDLTAQTILQIKTREDVHTFVKAKDLPENSMLFTVLKKSAFDQPFQLPMQGYYRKALSESAMEAWRELR
jgi:hypothetical protein